MAVWSCGYRLAPSGRPLRLRLAPRSSSWLRGRLYTSAAPARAQPQTLLPASWTSGSTLLRFPRGSGLAGGFQQGGELLLCFSLCRGSRFLGSGRVPRCLLSVRFFHGMLAQGPASGRRLALMASSSFCRSSVARCCSKVFPRYVVALGPSGSFERRQWCSDARVAQTAMSGG